VREAELLITCGTLLACVLAAIWRARPKVQAWGLAAALMLVAPLVYAWTQMRDAAQDDRRVSDQQPADRTERARSRWASANSCESCHPGAHASWAQTYHRRMTQRATEDAVLADWQGTVTDQGRNYQLLRDGDRFLVEMPRYGTTGEKPEDRMRRPIVLTTGSHHQQLYWLTIPWSDTQTPAGAAQLYRERCASCHGPEGWGAEAGALAEENLFWTDIDTVLTAEGHQALLKPPLTEEERVLIGELLLRMQSKDRLMQFPLAWMVKEKRWVNEEHTFLHPEPSDAPVEPYQEGWSNSCDHCHAVGARFKEGGLGDLGRSEVVDLGIACESCHGPGAAHVGKYTSPASRYAAHLEEEAVDDIVNPAKLSPERSVAVCGRCHAESWPLATPAPRPFRAGDRLEDFVRVVQLEAEPRPAWLVEAARTDPELLESGFWKDGTIRIAGRDYNGLTISPCHTEGDLTCVDCHQMHGADPNDQLAASAKTGLDACGGCHEAIAADPAGHSHHAADSDGAECMNCHMPRTTYGLLSVIRAHRIDSPSVIQSQLGRPNACNLCHLDKTLGEVGQHLSAWYGQPKPVGLQRDNLSAAVRWMITGDAVQRAVVVWHAGWEPAQRASGSWWLAPHVAQLLDDPYASVRFLAGQALHQLAGFEDEPYDYTGPLEQRIRTSATVVDTWLGLDHAGKHLPQALIHRGVLDQAALTELDSTRNDAPVTVNE
jgi:Doubled CXXCH motif (Paired_CXXCH_1)